MMQQTEHGIIADIVPWQCEVIWVTVCVLLEITQLGTHDWWSVFRSLNQSLRKYI